MSHITLEKMNEKNWAIVTKLSVSEKQKAVFPIENVYWLGISKYEEHTQLYAIKSDSEYVGMTGIGVINKQTGIINPFMIDKNFQNQGIGTTAMHEIISEFGQNNEISVIRISIRKNNEQGKKFFDHFGFQTVDEDHKDYFMEYHMDV